MRQIRVKAIFKLGASASFQFLALTSVLAAQSVSSFENETTTTSNRRSAFVNTSDLASPNAEEVISDVQSAHSWSRFQRGEINGFRYVMFPDGEAKIYGNQGRQILRLKMDCTLAVSCVIVGSDGERSVVPAQGAEKPTLPEIANEFAIATYLAEWILAGSGTPPHTGEEEPDKMAQAGVIPVVGELADLEETAPPTVVDTVDSTKVESEFTPTQDTSLPEVISPPKPAEQEVATLDKETCSERAQFIPTTCAQPTPPAVSSVLNDSDVLILNENQEASPTDVLDETRPLSFSDQFRLRCALTSSVNVAYEAADDAPPRPGKPRISLGCGASLTNQLSLRVSVLKYLKPEQQEDYDPDFTYALTYRMNDTMSVSYTNYAGRFDRESGGLFGALSDGNLRARFRLPAVNLPNDKIIACSASISVLDPIVDSANLSCGYSVTEKLQFGATAYFYFPNRQTEFQPDFSYNATYRVNENWLLSYSNYSNNRWSWNPSGGAKSGLEDGSVALSYSFKF